MSANLIIKKYYDVITMLLFYETSEAADDIKKKIVSAICNIYKRDELCELCSDEIAQAEIVKVYTDGVLLENTSRSSCDAVISAKMQILTMHKISKLKVFDWDLFVSELEEAAFAGQKNACALEAFINWIGFGGRNDREKALNIWRELAFSGDELSIRALIHAYTERGEGEQAEHWASVCEMLENAERSFCPIVKEADYAADAASAVRVANIILLLKQRSYRSDAPLIDRYMLYYIMNSEDDYFTKISKLSGEGNFLKLILKEEKLENKKYGF